jgi:glycosyltransferase involved in cell wall biosynthesis
MRVLHVVKTSDGALWAARQAAELTRRGIEVHVAVPSSRGEAMGEWRRSGAHIHVCPLDFPARAPWRWSAACRAARRLVSAVEPDLIHSHFVGTTLLLRQALGRDHEIPRVFQVPGPLHLEHWPFRKMELATAGRNDFWIGTSKYIVDAYLKAGVPAGRVFLSYHGGSALDIPAGRTGALRRRLGISAHEFVVGNANFMYPPKTYLGQKTGIKCHEDVIDALRLVLNRRSDVVGVLIGGVFGNGRWYEERLRLRARAAAGDRIRMPGYLPGPQIAESWADFDCAVHVPLSENCGGVIDPLRAGVPTIAARVGGLPEVVRDGVTGRTVRGGHPAELATAILDVLQNLQHYRRLAANGTSLVRGMFDVRRTAGEVCAVYRHLMDPACPRPDEFDCSTFLNRIADSSEYVTHSRECQPSCTGGNPFPQR